MEVRVLFVCTGNTCRSPMAEFLFREAIKPWDKNHRIQAASAGIMAFGGASAMDETIQVMDEMDIDISGHSARGLTAEMVEKADYIIALAPGHVQMIEDTYPEYKNKITLLGAGIPDPYGTDIKTYRQTRGTLEILIKKLAAQIGQRTYNTGV